MVKTRITRIARISLKSLLSTWSNLDRLFEAGFSALLTSETLAESQLNL
ncbi:MAG TPA: hypothetical protein VEL71_06155 [Candidatus Dormibacteraeota bacterium]|nr:hypothetical protein [Candidatus Dormibacteraeota bacterium]